GAVLGAVLIGLVQSHRPALEGWIVQSPASRLKLLAGGAVLAIGLPLVIAASCLWRTADRIARAERFPPPGMAVTRDTPILRGAPHACAAPRLGGAAAPSRPPGAPSLSPPSRCALSCGV